MDFTPALSRRKGRESSLPNPAKFILLFPKSFERHGKCRLNYYLQVRPSTPGALQQCLQAAPAHIGPPMQALPALCWWGWVVWTCHRGSCQAPGQQSQRYSWDMVPKG